MVFTVIASRYEPYPGFMERPQGVTGTVAFFGTGLMHSFYCKPNSILDVVWADLVVNMHLLNIARIGLMKDKLKKPEVALICAYPQDQLKLRERYDWIVKTQRKYPFSKCFGHYNLKTVSCYYYFVLRVLVYQVVPSIFLDMLLRASNIRPMAMFAQRKMFAGSKELVHFCTRSFQSDGATNIADLLRLSRDSVFKIDSTFETINDAGIETSYKAYLMGTRKYLLKDDESTLPAARKRYKMWVLLLV